jgi:hypothetical protein
MISSNKIEMSVIKYDVVDRLLSYNKDTGYFSWKVSRGTRKAGSMAGCVNPSTGYSVVRINRRGYSAHRLAWLLAYGYLPENGIDHIDRNKLNNSISNLREATQSCNLRNITRKKNNTSGITGVRWKGNNKIWEARIYHNKKDTYVGGSVNFDEAVAFRLSAEQCLGWPQCNSHTDAYLHIKKITDRYQKITKTKM